MEIPGPPRDSMTSTGQTH